MLRREFITLLGGAASWPLSASAQQPGMPVIGYLSSQSPSATAPWLAAFREGLKELGYVEGQNVHIAFRWAEGRYEQMQQLAGELAQSRVSVIVATGGLPSALAARNATTTIPIVLSASDPVRSGLVASLNRPGGNITGVSPLNAFLEAKRLGLLHEMAPRAAVIGLLSNPSYPDIAFQINDVEQAARTLGVQLHIVHTRNEDEIDSGFASIAQRRAGAVLLGTDPFFTQRRNQIVALATRYALPTMSGNRELTLVGGLASYGPSFADVYRQVGLYTGRILKGEKPADLPIVQSSKFEFIINLKTAKALDLTIPPGMLAIADEVID